MELLTFPLTPPPNPFNLYTQGFNDIRPVKFSLDSSSSNLSIELNQQINNNLFNARLLELLCQEEETPHIVLNPEPYLTRTYYKEACPKFLLTFPSLLDVFSRDYDAMHQNGYNVTIYATLLLFQEEYFGHIYSYQP